MRIDAECAECAEKMDKGIPLYRLSLITNFSANTLDESRDLLSLLIKAQNIGAGFDQAGVIDIWMTIRHVPSDCAVVSWSFGGQGWSNFVAPLDDYDY